MTSSEKQQLEEPVEDRKATIETDVQLLDGFNNVRGYIKAQFKIEK